MCSILYFYARMNGDDIGSFAAEMIDQCSEVGAIILKLIAILDFGLVEEV